MPTQITEFYEEDVQVIDLTMENMEFNFQHYGNNSDLHGLNVGVFIIAYSEKPSKQKGFKTNHVSNTSKLIDFFA